MGIDLSKSRELGKLSFNLILILIPHPQPLSWLLNFVVNTFYEATQLKYGILVVHVTYF